MHLCKCRAFTKLPFFPCFAFQSTYTFLTYTQMLCSSTKLRSIQKFTLSPVARVLHGLLYTNYIIDLLLRTNGFSRSSLNTRNLLYTLAIFCQLACLCLTTRYAGMHIWDFFIIPCFSFRV